jgi:uncharacterized damage-inducible protein DinB
VHVTIGRPSFAAPENCEKYIRLVTGNDLLESLERELDGTISLIRDIPEEMGNFSHAPGKWTIREVLNHIIDQERIFAYRALRFSRGDATPLEGFDESVYNTACNAGNRSLGMMEDEFVIVREATIALFSYMTSEMLDFSGLANGMQVTPRMIGWMTAGHEIHHRNILLTKYLSR